MIYRRQKVTREIEVTIYECENNRCRFNRGKNGTEDPTGDGWVIVTLPDIPNGIRHGFCCIQCVADFFYYPQHHKELTGSFRGFASDRVEGSGEPVDWIK